MLRCKRSKVDKRSFRGLPYYSPSRYGHYLHVLWMWDVDTTNKFGKHSLMPALCSVNPLGTGDFRSDPRHKSIKYRRFFDLDLEEWDIDHTGYLLKAFISLDVAKWSTAIAEDGTKTREEWAFMFLCLSESGALERAVERSASAFWMAMIRNRVISGLIVSEYSYDS